VSTARASRERTPGPAPVPADIATLHARRREARRRRRLTRVDLGLGIAAALALLIASPGLAVTGLISVFVFAGCVISVFAERRMRGRVAKASAARRRAGDGVSRRS
jgi:hypothetical protein